MKQWLKYFVETSSFYDCSIYFEPLLLFSVKCTWVMVTSSWYVFVVKNIVPVKRAVTWPFNFYTIIWTLSYKIIIQNNKKAAINTEIVSIAAF